MSRIAVLALIAVAACSGGGSSKHRRRSSGRKASLSFPSGTPPPTRSYTWRRARYTGAARHPTDPRSREYQDRLVRPGETVTVTDIIGYQAHLGVNFFLYRVEPGSGEARYANSLLATAAELARRAVW
jgi:hypothetical protein